MSYRPQQYDSYELRLRRQMELARSVTENDRQRRRGRDRALDMMAGLQ